MAEGGEIAVADGDWVEQLVFLWSWPAGINRVVGQADVAIRRRAFGAGGGGTGFKGDEIGAAQTIQNKQGSIMNPMLVTRLGFLYFLWHNV